MSSNRIRVALIGGEYDLTRMEIEYRGGHPLEMPERMTMHVIHRDWRTSVPHEAVCQILRYFPRCKTADGTTIYEYRPHE